MVKFAYAFQTEETKRQLLCAQGEHDTVLGSLADIGYDAVELLVRDPNALNFNALDAILKRNHLSVASLGTGPMVADDNLSLCSDDETVRAEALKRVLQLIRWAEMLDTTVNIGKLRGNASRHNPEKSWSVMTESFGIILEESQKRNVKVLIEPQNETQINTLNTVDEASDFIGSFKSSSLGLMLDLLHLEKEDVPPGELVEKVSHQVKYFHLTDSGRMIPGDGTFDIGGFINDINDVDPNLYAGLEIHQKEDQLQTAGQAFQFLVNYK